MYSRIEAIIFDVDGTLIGDDIHFRKHNYVLCREYGLGEITLTPDEWALIGGLSDNGAYAFIERKVQDAGIDAARVPPLDTYLQKTERYLKEHMHQIEMRAGAADILAAATASERPIGIATNTTRHETEMKLNAIGIRDRFKFISCLDDVIDPKPAPDIYLDALSKADLHGACLRSARQALVIEDTLAGATAALEAGCRTIWWRAHDKDKTPPPLHPNLLVEYDAAAIVHMIQRWTDKMLTRDIFINRPRYD